MATREIIENARTGEHYTKIMHDSGLMILIWQTPDSTNKKALFGTRYGSVDTTFKTDDDDDFITVPNGIAHYLEHKLFENEDCDVFSLYAKTGAFGNAYTSFDRTCYLFSCVNNFYDSLKILLDFVQKPYFTEETVQKEQGIIAQEIKMYQDDPNWRVFFNMLCGIYHKNPVNIDIAGTVESIAQIDAPLLYRCYNTFYNLPNMFLAIAGDVDIDEVLKLCDEMLRPCEDKHLISIVPEEPTTVVEKYIEQEFEVAVPLFSIGYKSEPIDNKDQVFMEVLSDITLELIAGDTSDFYKKIYDTGLLNTTFCTETFCGNGFFVPIFSGESRDPKKLCELINEEIDRIKKEGLDKSRFDMIKKSYYGSAIRKLNTPDSLASMLVNTAVANCGTAFSELEYSAKLTLEDCMKFINERLDTTNCTLSVITTKGGK